MSPRQLVTAWVVLFAVALVVGAAAWQALGWFESLQRVVIAALVWATLVTGWLWLRPRVTGRGG